jgi:hypothetical protein
MNWLGQRYCRCRRHNEADAQSHELRAQTKRIGTVLGTSTRIFIVRNDALSALL